MRLFNILIMTSTLSVFSCQSKQSIQELNDPQELVGQEQPKKQPKRPDYAIKAPDFELRTVKGEFVKNTFISSTMGISYKVGAK